MAASKQVAVVIIGDEILEGSTVDCNAATLITWAAAQGHRVINVQIVGDAEELIISALRRARSDGAEIIVTTGGVGPTIDDLTVASVGKSMGIDEQAEMPEMVDALTAWIGEEPHGVRRRTATAPLGTKLLFPQRAQGGLGWPVFIVGDTFCLPGIPRLVEKLLALLPLGPGPRPFAKLQFFGRETQGAPAMEQVAALYPDLSFGSYPPTKEPRDRCSLTIRGDDSQRVEAAMQDLLEALASTGLKTQRSEQQGALK
ncbi:MAG: molybdopterin-binding protein [Myxococcota bacterium]|nr:molybdopterin-binding protein [Myxococcota bacterium]